MGHEIQTISFNYSGNIEEDKKRIFEVCDRVHRNNCEYHSSLDGLAYENKTFETEEEARRYLEGHEGFYWQGVVKYKEWDYKPNRKSESLKKKIEALWVKIGEERQKLSEYIKKNSLKNRKSTYVGCPKCGSKLHKDYITEVYSMSFGLAKEHYQTCPLCKENLSSPTFRETQKRYVDKINEMIFQHQELQKEEEKLKRTNFKLKWMAKVEYHV